MNIRVPFLSSIRLTTIVVVFLSLLMAAYWPIANSNVNAVAEINLADLKEDASKEIDRRIDSYQKSLDSLTKDQNFTLGTNIKIMNLDGSVSTSVSVDEDDMGSSLLLPQRIKDQSKKMLEAIIEQLRDLKDEVMSTKTLAEMEELSENIDEQFQVTQFVEQQALVAKAITSMSDVYGKVQDIHGKLKDRVKALKECFNQNGGATTSPSPSSSASPSTTPSPSSSSSPSDEDCEGLPFGSQDMLNNSQSRMDGIQSVLSAIGSILMSVVSLFMTIITALISFVTGLFSSLTGSLGSLTSITGMLGSLGSIGDLGGLMGGLGGAGGGLGGLTTALSSIPSQLGNASGMAGGASGLLGSANSFINFIPLQ